MINNSQKSTKGIVHRLCQHVFCVFALLQAAKQQPMGGGVFEAVQYGSSQKDQPGALEISRDQPHGVVVVDCNLQTSGQDEAQEQETGW
jgi:hypothetical protein